MTIAEHNMDSSRTTRSPRPTIGCGWGGWFCVLVLLVIGSFVSRSHGWSGQDELRPQRVESETARAAAEDGRIVRRARQLVKVDVPFGLGEGAPKIDADAAEKVLRSVEANPRRLVTLVFSGTPMRFSDLPPSTQELLLERGGTEVIRKFEEYVAEQVMDLLDEIRAKEPRASLAIKGLPFEGGSPSASESNARFAAVLDDLDAFVADRVLMASSRGDELALAKSTFPESLELAGERAILYPGRGGWRIILAGEDARRVLASAGSDDRDVIPFDLSEDDPLVVGALVATDDRFDVDVVAGDLAGTGPGEAEGVPVPTSGTAGESPVGGRRGGGGRAIPGSGFGSTAEVLNDDPAAAEDRDSPSSAPVDPVDSRDSGTAEDPLGERGDDPSADDADDWNPVDEIGDDPVDDDGNDDPVGGDDSGQDEDSTDDGGVEDDRSDDGVDDSGDSSSDDPIEVDEPEVLIPGSGWNGPPSDPGSVGNGGMPGFDASVIARWNVVPHQIVNETIDIGILAFHVNGIDRVEISVDGGAPVVIEDRAFNARTGVDEFVARLDPAEFGIPSHPAEIRATAYPLLAGQAIELDSLNMLMNHDSQVLWCAEWGSDVNGTGTRENPFRQPGEAIRQFQVEAGGVDAVGACDGLTINLMPGDYDATAGLSPFASTEHTWLTIQGDPDLESSAVRFTSGGGVRTRYVRFANLTFFETQVPSRVLPGTLEKQNLWLDEIVSIGDGQMGDQEPLIGTAFETAYVTDSRFRELANGPKHCDLVRGCLVEYVSEDAYTRCLTIVDCEIRGLDPKPLAHPDIYQIFCDDEHDGDVPKIIYGLRAIDVDAQLVFLNDCERISNLAMVNMVLVTRGELMPLEPYWSQLKPGRLSNIIIENVTIPNQRFHIDCSDIENFVIRSSIFFNMRATESTPVEMIEASNNHFVDVFSWGTITPGTNWTSGPVPMEGGVLPVNGPTMWPNDDFDRYRPLRGSVVDDRVIGGDILIDATSLPRSIPTTLGGLQANN